MKRGTRVTARVFLLLLALVGLATSDVHAGQSDLVPDRLIVHFADGHRPEPQFARRWLRPNVAVVPLPRSGSLGEREPLYARRARLQRWREAWLQHPGVVHVEPDHLGQFSSDTSTAGPPDPQWFARIQARQLWEIGSGSGITVALIDSGVDRRHPALSGTQWADGWDFGDGDADTDDCLGHGTAVAAILAAGAGNGTGLTGIAPAVRVLPLKISACRDNTSTYATSAVAEAIDYAVAHGAHIINLSLDITETTELLNQTVASALARGVLIVASAGNKPGQVAYPANLPGVIAVGATDADGQPASAWGSSPGITIAAPGTNILTAALGGSLASRTGTSFSAPMVSGSLAGLLSANPAMDRSAAAALLLTAASPISGHSFGELRAGEMARQFIAAPATFSAVSEVSGNGLRLRAIVQPAAVHVGMRVNAFIAAVGETGWMKSIDGWQPLTWPLTSAGMLLLAASTPVDIAEQLSVEGLRGMKVYVGFGLSADEMLQNGRYSLIYTVGP